VRIINISILNVRRGHAAHVFLDTLFAILCTYPTFFFFSACAICVFHAHRHRRTCSFKEKNALYIKTISRRTHNFFHVLRWLALWSAILFQTHHAKI